LKPFVRSGVLHLVALPFLLAFTSFAGEVGTLPPTLVYDASATVESGGECQIVLRAVPNYGNRIAFEVVSPPGHGNLGGITNTSDSTAVLTYSHDGSLDARNDQFLFRASTPGHAKSSAGKVLLAITPPESRIRFEPPVLDFGKVFAGETNRLSLAITNPGKISSAGRLLLPKGFSAFPDESFNIPAGGRHTVFVSFAPPEAKQYSGRASIVPALRQDCLELKGIGVSRFEVSESAPGVFSVRSLARDPILISFSGGEGLLLPSDLSLSPGETSLLSFGRDPRAVGKVAGEASAPPPAVRLSDGFTVIRITPSAMKNSLPVIIEREGSDFLGSPRVGETVPVFFRLMNRSSSRRSILLDPQSSTGRIQGRESLLTLEPMESRRIGVFWTPSVTGNAGLEVFIGDEGSKRKLTWSATPRSPGESKSDANPSRDAVDESAPETDQSGSEGSFCSLPGVPGLSWELLRPWFGKPILRLTLPSPVPSSSCLVEESRAVLSPDFRPGEALGEGSPITLVNLPLQVKQKPSRKNSLEILVPDLAPGWHLMRVLLVPDASGNPNATIAALSQIQVFVPGKAPWIRPLSVFLGVMLILALMGFLIRERTKRN
jgi:hypothetical protein